MTETSSDMDFDEGFFSPEELAMMNGSDGDSDDVFVTPDIKDLQDQLTAMANLVSEGCEREQELRVIVKGMRATEADAKHTQSLQVQTETLARMVISSVERERALQDNLDQVRGLFAGNSAIDR